MMGNNQNKSKYKNVVKLYFETFHILLPFRNNKNAGKCLKYLKMYGLSYIGCRMWNHIAKERPKRNNYN